LREISRDRGALLVLAEDVAPPGRLVENAVKSAMIFVDDIDGMSMHSSSAEAAGVAILA
jgi:hypothetical protein